MPEEEPKENKPDNKPTPENKPVPEERPSKDVTPPDFDVRKHSDQSKKTII